jgi:hypothetical protein
MLYLFHCRRSFFSSETKALLLLIAATSATVLSTTSLSTSCDDTTLPCYGIRIRHPWLSDGKNYWCYNDPIELCPRSSSSLYLIRPFDDSPGYYEIRIFREMYWYLSPYLAHNGDTVGEVPVESVNTFRWIVRAGLNGGYHIVSSFTDGRSWIVGYRNITATTRVLAMRGISQQDWPTTEPNAEHISWMIERECPIGSTYDATVVGCRMTVKGVVCTCPAGSFGSCNTCPCPQGTCAPCTAGSFCNNIYTRPAICPKDFYCPLGAIDPLPCYRNATTASTGSTSIDQCVCAPGHYVSTSFACEACEPGTYCPLGTLPYKNICEAGYYCLNGIDRVACQVGQHCPPRSTQPLPCPDGHMCSNTTLPTKCAMGSYCMNNATKEEDCPAGSYCPSPEVRIACVNNGTYCPPRSTREGPCYSKSYCPNSATIYECPVSTYCPAGMVEPQPCPIGKYCPTTWSAIDCYPKSYCVGSNTQEQPCPLGSYCPTPSEKYECNPGDICVVGSLSPSPCSAGYFCPDYETAEICPKTKYCPPKSTKPLDCPTLSDTIGRGATAISDCLCLPGHHLDGDWCRECSEGTYQAIPNRDSECISCPDGSTTLTRGVTNSDTCVCKVGYEYQRGLCSKCRTGFEKLQVGNEACQLAKIVELMRNDTVQCSGTNYRDEQTNTCKECQGGTYLVGAKCKACTADALPCCTAGTTNATEQYVCLQCRDSISKCQFSDAVTNPPWYGLLSITFLALTLVNLSAIAWDYVRGRMRTGRLRSKSNADFSSQYIIMFCGLQ